MKRKNSFARAGLLGFARTILRLGILLAAIVLLSLLFPRLLVYLDTQPHLFDRATVPPKLVAIVFGAGLTRSGEVSPELGDRVAMASNLYLTGKVGRLLMSGDNRFLNYNEPGAMRKYAMRLGVPADAIVLDFAGRRTYDTCYRARSIFGLQDAILVSQEYHLLRAVYTCRELGLDVVGVPADRPGSPYVYGNLRELPATLTALLEIYVTHPVPVLGKPEPIQPISNTSGLPIPSISRSRSPIW